MPKIKTPFHAPLEGIHLFRKLNGATLFDSIGQYDEMKCSECGIKGKTRNLRTVEFEKFDKKIANCNLSKQAIEQKKKDDTYSIGTITKLKCPKCQNQLSETGQYMEEGQTNISAWKVTCRCGFSEFIKPPKEGDTEITKF